MLESQVGRYNTLWLCVQGAVLLNLCWFSASDYIKNMEYRDDRNFIGVYVCRKLSQYSVSQKKTSPTFLAVTRESIV